MVFKRGSTYFLKSALKETSTTSIFTFGDKETREGTTYSKIDKWRTATLTQVTWNAPPSCWHFCYNCQNNLKPDKSSIFRRLSQLLDLNEQCTQITNTHTQIHKHKHTHTIKQIVTLINYNLTKISMLILLDEAVQNNGEGLNAREWKRTENSSSKCRRTFWRTVTTRYVSHHFASHPETFHQLRHIFTNVRCFFLETQTTSQLALFTNPT